MIFLFVSSLRCSPIQFQKDEKTTSGLVNGRLFVVALCSEEMKIFHVSQFVMFGSLFTSIDRKKVVDVCLNCKFDGLELMNRFVSFSFHFCWWCEKTTLASFSISVFGCFQAIKTSKQTLFVFYFLSCFWRSFYLLFCLFGMKENNRLSSDIFLLLALGVALCYAVSCVWKPTTTATTTTRKGRITTGRKWE